MRTPPPKSLGEILKIRQPLNKMRTSPPKSSRYSTQNENPIPLWRLSLKSSFTTNITGATKIILPALSLNLVGFLYIYGSNIYYSDVE